MYTRADPVGWEQSTAFKKAFSIDVKVEILGVWFVVYPSLRKASIDGFFLVSRDTVGAVGLIPRRLPFTTSNTHVRYFRHAISLDERRVRFMPNFWHRTHEKDQHLGVRRGDMPASRKKHHNKLLRELERQNSDMDHPTDVEEVWFAGCHTGTVNTHPLPLRPVVICLSLMGRRRRRLGGQRHAQQPSADPAPVDDPAMLPAQHGDPVPPRGVQARRAGREHALAGRPPASAGGVHVLVRADVAGALHHPVRQHGAHARGRDGRGRVWVRVRGGGGSRGRAVPPIRPAQARVAVVGPGGAPADASVPERRRHVVSDAAVGVDAIIRDFVIR